MVCFNELGQVLKTSLPTDVSFARVTGFQPDASIDTVTTVLDGFGFQLAADCIRLHRCAESTGFAVTLKMDSPSLGKELCATINKARNDLTAVTLSDSSRRKDARKVHTSWHKASRSVWLNFGNETVASRVGRRFNESKYKCLDQSVRSSDALRSSTRGGRHGFSHNPVPWTITLSGVPSNATKQDVQDAIYREQDHPRHIEMGRVSYQASEAEVSVEVRTHLEKHGPLESFNMTPLTNGKRQKATAFFYDEADARSACSLNNKTFSILGKGKLTVTQIQSFKIKVSTKVYLATKDKIDEANNIWRQSHLSFRVYQDASERFTTLKLEGESLRDLAEARVKLDKILNGDILVRDGTTIWHPSLVGDTKAIRMLNSVEREIDMIIIRDKNKFQLKFYGPTEKYALACQRVVDLVKTIRSFSEFHEIFLEPDDFSWAIQGGFRSIVQALGEKVAVFDVVSKKIIVNGDQKQYNRALHIIESKRDKGSVLASSDSSLSEDCPICLDKPDTPVLTSCKHTYCLDCFEQCCASATSTDKDGFQMKCYGDAGKCSTTFTLQEVRQHLSSSDLENILRLSFEAYIQRHPDKFRYCPTPDCGFVYRCSTKSNAKMTSYTCPNCFEDICTSCHARHGGYSCAEYKDIASGGVEALKKLKRELNIKDCPKCSTPMEKTEGCNHMVCGGCKAHICWVCMAVFVESNPCYDHMNKVHGGIGLDYLA